MKRLNEVTIKVGDIVLTTTTAAVSKAIRSATRSDISHAMVYVEDRSVIDATSEGVQARNTQRLFFEDECAVYALRLQGSISTDQLRAISTFLRSRIGTQYSKKEAFLTAYGGGQQWTKKQFCSRLVAQAFETAGIKLVDNPNFCAPADIKSSPLLVDVVNATVPVSKEEQALWEGLEDIPQMMRDAINAVLDGARKKSKDIQTFDDLHVYLVAHPEDDEYFCELLESSGYLTLWVVEQRNNPWQYDRDLMSKGPADEIERYCWAVLADENAGPNRYLVNRGGYSLFYRQYGLRFFDLMTSLYEHLVKLHQRRIATAARWLENAQLLQPAPEVILRPHTPEWFAALDVWDPAQALMTRTAIQAAGSEEVCSICGDDPAVDYHLEQGFRPTGGVETLRLCDDCLEIRWVRGESFAPLNVDENR